MKKSILMAFLAISTLTISAQNAPIKATCKAITKQGTPCKRGAKVDGFCGQHNPNAFRCGAPTKSGGTCKMVVKTEGLKCHNHNK